jgi:hypothetical protein
MSAFLLLALSPLSSLTVHAQNAETDASNFADIRIVKEGGVPLLNDFILAPTRLFATLSPGESKTMDIEVTSRMADTSSFAIEMEDFAAGPSEKESTKLYGSVAGPYSARSWLKPVSSTFTLKSGEKAIIPVTLTVPANADAGDHYVALLVKRFPGEGETTDKGFDVISRVGALFMVTVRGELRRDGSLVSLKSDAPVYFTYPVSLALQAQNKGTVHFVPSGSIVIKNLLGVTVDEIQVKDWVVLRDSVRTITYPWHPRFALGMYTAEAQLEIFGEKAAPVSARFWVFPALPLLLALFVIFTVSFLVQFFFSRFEIKKKD